MRISISLILLALGLVTVAQKMPELDQRFADTKNGFLISFPNSWSIETRDIGGYALKVVDPDEYGSVYVKVTDMKGSIEAKTIVKNFIEPAWTKDGATIVELPEDKRIFSENQLFLKNADSGYITKINYPLEDGFYNIGYFVFTKDTLVYEIKYEGIETAPSSVSNVLPRIGLSLVAL